MRIVDLGRMFYREAWARQEQEHAQVCEGGEERLLLVEHPPVITLGRRAEIEAEPLRHVIATAAHLADAGVEVISTDRGGDVTFHGPGQIVAYPIVRLADHRLSVGAYVRKLQAIVIAVLAAFGIEAWTDESAIGVWTGPPSAAAKICAIGVRIKRGVSLHGIALNVQTDLDYFKLIVPCGLPARGVTSMRALLGEATPSMADVKRELASEFSRVLDEKMPQKPLIRVMSS